MPESGISQLVGQIKGIKAEIIPIGYDACTCQTTHSRKLVVEANAEDQLDQFDNNEIDRVTLSTHTHCPNHG